MNQDSKLPIPQGQYLPAVRHNDIVYTSGMTPRKNGVLIYPGKIKADKPIETYREAVQLATKNALMSVQTLLQKDEKISLILQLTIYLCSDKNFDKHSKIADFASAMLVEELGAKCIGSRAAVGVKTLPSNAPVEVTMIAVISKTKEQ